MAERRVDPHLGTSVHVVGTRQARPNLPVHRLPVLPRRPRGARALRRALVPQPVAGDAGRPVRGRAVHPRARRHVRVARRRRRPQGDRPVGAAHRRARRPRRRRLRARASRTGGRRWAPPSPTRTARSTPTTTCPSGRCACSRRSGRPTSNDRRTTGRRARRLARRRARTPAPIPIALVGRSRDRRCPTCRRSTTHGRDALAALLVDVLARLDRAVRPAAAVHDVAQPAAHRRRRLAATRGSTSRSCHRGAGPASPRFIAAAEVAAASSSTRSSPRSSPPTSALCADAGTQVVGGVESTGRQPSSHRLSSARAPRRGIRACVSIGAACRRAVTSSSGPSGATSGARPKRARSTSRNMTAPDHHDECCPLVEAQAAAVLGRVDAQPLDPEPAEAVAEQVEREQPPRPGLQHAPPGEEQ